MSPSNIDGKGAHRQELFDDFSQLPPTKKRIDATSPFELIIFKK